MAATSDSLAAAEKQQEFSHHDSPTRLSSEENHDIDHGFTKEEQRIITRRIDRRLVVTLGAMYCVSLMDRTNMSAANIAGMGVELELTGYRYVSNPHLTPTMRPGSGVRVD
jgi:hypothetical protein